MSKPLDPRLLRISIAARKYFATTVVLGAVSTIAVVVGALLTGEILSGIITDPSTRSLGSWRAQLIALVVVALVRAGAMWAQTRFGGRIANTAVSDMKNAVLQSVSRSDDRRRGEDVATVVTAELDGLRGYFTGYLPALVLSAVLTPVLIVVVFLLDHLSAYVIVGTLPLIPIFMILIGLLTRSKGEARLADLARFASQLLDIVAGLPTLRAFGRELDPIARLRRLSEANRHSTMTLLKIAFLSACVLELLASLCVALVAVEIGLRLVFGEMSLRAGLTVLMIAPEVYLPLRTVGARFHAAQEGMTAADRAFEIIDGTPARATGSIVPADVTIEFDAVSVASREGFAPRDLSLTLRAGELVMLTGANGCGKSSALQTVLNLITPAHGSVRIGGVEVTQIDPEWLREHIAWLPQRPVMLSGTLRDNLFGVSAHRAALTEFDRVVDRAPKGWDTVLGEGGIGLSVGERQRLALTRTVGRSASIYLLDEPTAHLDSATEARLLAMFRELADAGALVVVVAHRPELLTRADRVVTVESADYELAQ